jgi:hypothetical protein
MDERVPVSSARARAPRSTCPFRLARSRPQGLVEAAVAALAAVLMLAPAAARGAGSASAADARPAAALAAGSATAADTRPFHVVSEQVVYCPTTATVQFTVRFNQRPDFRTVDEFGRREDDFQYFIVGDPALPYPQNYDAIVRGPELTLSGRTGSLPIRRSQPPDPDPASGGWGSIRATVPVHLTGTRLTFTAPLAALSDHSVDGRFTYELWSLNFGAIVDFLTGESVIGDC